MNHDLAMETNPYRVIYCMQEIAAAHLGLYFSSTRVQLTNF